MASEPCVLVGVHIQHYYTITAATQKHEGDTATTASTNSTRHNGLLWVFFLGWKGPEMKAQRGGGRRRRRRVTTGGADMKLAVSGPASQQVPRTEGPLLVELWEREGGRN